MGLRRSFLPLFTLVRGRGILRTSALQSSRKLVQTKDRIHYSL
jgi:hypothetical protein